MQNPRDWDEEYILNLPIGEFDWFEIKGRQGLDLNLPTVKESDVKQNLSKAISAFANSGGGILVLGLRDPTTQLKVDDGGIDLFVKKSGTREWLEDIIPNLVDAPLNKFNVYVIQKGNDRSQIVDGRGVFLIEVFDSEQAPHQALDNKYYARVGGKSRPIGHKLVTDIFGRRRHPKIQLDFEIKVTKHIEESDFGDPPLLPANGEIVIRAKNVGRVLARFVNCTIFIPIEMVHKIELEADYKDEDFEEIDGHDYVSWSKSNTQRDFLKISGMGLTEYGPSWFDPILPGLNYIWEWNISEDFDQEKLSDLYIHWEAFADNAPMEKGAIKIGEINVVYAERKV